MAVAGGAGYFAIKKNAGKVVQNPAAQEQKTDETASWKTYVNEYYGFEFKYPASHTVFETANQEKQVLIPATKMSEMVEFAENESHVFCCEPATIFIDRVYHPEDKINLQGKDVLFKEKKAKELIGSGALGDPYRVLRVYVNGFNLNIVQNQKSNLLDAILSTFKFIESQGTNTDVTSQWEIYTNSEYGFTFRYPFGLVVGRKSPSSVLGTYDNKVPGIYLGSTVLVPAAGREDFYSIYERAFATQEERRESLEKASGPWAGCYKYSVPNIEASVKIVDCIGEGGPAVYGLIEKGNKHVYIDGYSGGWAGQYGEEAPTGPSTREQLETILSTFRFTN